MRGRGAAGPGTRASAPGRAAMATGRPRRSTSVVIATRARSRPTSRSTAARSAISKPSHEPGKRSPGRGPPARRGPMQAVIARLIWAGSAVRSSIVCARAITAPSPAGSGSQSDRESERPPRIGATASQPLTSPTRHGPAVFRAGDVLDAGNGFERQEPEHERPVVGRPVVEPERDHVAGASWSAPTPEPRWRPAVRLPERGVEPAEAREAGGEGDLRHGQIRLVEQPLRGLHATVARQEPGRRAAVLDEQARQMARPDAHRGREVGEPPLVEQPAVDQGQRARHGRAGSPPGR